MNSTKSTAHSAESGQVSNYNKIYQAVYGTQGNVHVSFHVK
jgi:hypothetical protein